MKILAIGYSILSTFIFISGIISILHERGAGSYDKNDMSAIFGLSLCALLGTLTIAYIIPA